MKQFVVVVRRESSRVTSVEILERVFVDIEESFKARCGEESRAFSIRLSAEGAAAISEVSCEDRPFFSFAWYEEKYLCDNSIDLYDRVAAITSSSEVLTWLGAKL